MYTAAQLYLGYKQDQNFDKSDINTILNKALHARVVSNSWYAANGIGVQQIRLGVTTSRSNPDYLTLTLSIKTDIINDYIISDGYFMQPNLSEIALSHEMDLVEESIHKIIQ